MYCWTRVGRDCQYAQCGETQRESHQIRAHTKKKRVYFKTTTDRKLTAKTVTYSDLSRRLLAFWPNVMLSMCVHAYMRVCVCKHKWEMERKIGFECVCAPDDIHITTDANVCVCVRVLFEFKMQYLSNCLC